MTTTPVLGTGRLWLVVLLVLGCAAAPVAPQQRDAQQAPANQLRVGPAEGFTLTMDLGGAAPRRTEFLVANPGPLAIDWRASCDVDWLELKRTEGTSKNRARTSVVLVVDEDVARRLGPGRHVAVVSFTNTTNGEGSTTREIVLLVIGTKGLVARPVGASAFELLNESDGPVDWRSRTMAPWLRAEPRSGTLEPGHSVAIELGVDRDLPAGRTFPARVGLAFVNTTDGVGTILRTLDVDPGSGRLTHAERVSSPAGVASLRDSVSQFGITWTFDLEAEVGRFANGDPWVVGPLLVTRLNPPSIAERGRTMNGSMISPSPSLGIQQGYDSAMYGKYANRTSYAPKLNAALDVSTRKPMLLVPGQSVVSTISLPEAGARPQVATAAILTVLDRPAPKGSFRPPYAGKNKKVRFHVDDLDRARLTYLPRVASTPTLASVERKFARPWIDHVSMWIGRYIHPKANMPDYGREITDHVSTAALMLLLDFPEEQKETLLVRFVQLGIDLHGLLKDGARWPPAAGHLNGRKWPILFAGIMLGDKAMRDIGKDYDDTVFSEDGQTFYVKAADPALGYTQKHVGMAEWGASHSTHPHLDDPRWTSTQPFPTGATHVQLRTQNIGYRLCCTANTFWGQLLAARIMGAKELWAHDALFDYQDRFREVNERQGITDVRNTWQRFYFDMWKLYRPEY